jgi:hypothetical protein
MTDLEDRLRGSDTDDLQNAIRTNSLIPEAEVLARKILADRKAVIPEKITEEEAYEEVKTKKRIYFSRFISFVTAYIAVQYSGANFIVPIIGMFLAIFILKKVFKQTKEPTELVFIISFGHASWFLFGIITNHFSSALLQVGGDLIIYIAGLTWLLKKPHSLRPSYFLAAYQIIGLIVCVVGLTDTAIGSAANRALASHLFWRIAALIALIAYIQDTKRTAKPNKSRILV